MKYRVSHLPNTGKEKQFKVQSAEDKKETSFSFSNQVLSVWGNPLESKLKEFMVAYIKRHGWSKERVAISPANSERNLNTQIAALPKGKASK